MPIPFFELEKGKIKIVVGRKPLVQKAVLNLGLDFFFFNFDLNFSVSKKMILTTRTVLTLDTFLIQILTQGNCGAME